MESKVSFLPFGPPFLEVTRLLAALFVSSVNILYVSLSPSPSSLCSSLSHISIGTTEVNPAIHGGQG